MKIKISEILKKRGMFSNDIRLRFKNKQIKLFGEPIDNIEVDIYVEDDNLDNLIMLSGGDFIFNLLKINKDFGQQLMFFDFETLPNSNIDNKLKTIIKKHYIIRTSKKDLFVI